MNRNILTLIASAALICATGAQAQSITVDQVIAMTKADLGDEAIVAKIKSDGKSFDLSTDEMISLRQNGVSSAVIAAMLSSGAEAAAPQLSLTSPDPAVPHPAGLYMFLNDGNGQRMQRMDPTVSSQAKTGGIFGYALTGGLASMSVKVAIANDSSRNLNTAPKPQFFMFLEESNGVSSGGSWSSGANTVITSPAELSLVRLTRKDGRREARVGSMNIAGAKTGVMDRDRLEFDYSMVRQGVFQVNVSEALEPGEYGFIYALSGTGTAGAMTARIFDFTIQ